MEIHEARPQGRSGTVCAGLMPVCIMIAALVLPGCDTDDYGMTFVSVPGGTFEMGCSEGDGDCFADEYPRHTVTLSPFRISTCEVTQGQWEAVMGRNPSRYYRCGSDCPVETVSWNAVQVFINRLNRRTGRGYRLCTEAEWEYAARAGAATRYPCGDDARCLDESAWYDNQGNYSPAPVGLKEPNAWGLYDMCGNVWEWVADRYADDYYGQSPAIDPQGPERGPYRVFRGGGWYVSPGYCRVSCRRFYLPDAVYNSVGFRLCLPCGQ